MFAFVRCAIGSSDGTISRDVLEKHQAILKWGSFDGEGGLFEHSVPQPRLSEQNCIVEVQRPFDDDVRSNED